MAPAPTSSAARSATAGAVGDEAETGTVGDEGDEAEGNEVEAGTEADVDARNEEFVSEEFVMERDARRPRPPPLIKLNSRGKPRHCG
ncbi:hypothetical protein [Streptomyces sp. AV19]|uniref:hypothetical protein n=1 Tax=Streptomyces sp. AV19 TaxID=2793068 RepID=UPI001F41B18F|nr:hypothetical protein [Streptomyces sp. AV19]MDG4531854.1 hypothetical protein [Streptomyces sp. AV19]